MPVTTSADFVSFIGNLDLRVDFDENVRPEDENYYAQLSLMASKASYENEAYLKSKVAEHWKVRILESVELSSRRETTRIGRKQYVIPAESDFLFLFLRRWSSWASTISGMVIKDQPKQ